MDGARRAGHDGTYYPFGPAADPGTGRRGAVLARRLGRRGLAGLGAERTRPDIGLLDPQRSVQYLARPCSPRSLEDLAVFLFTAASDRHPEQSLADFQDADLGLALSVVQSADLEVELEVLVVQNPGADLVEHDGLNFQTSRAVLVTAAQQVPALAEVPQHLDAEV